MDKNDTIKVAELFAGVGGFRVGLEDCSPKFKTVWANQWEPGKEKQYAFDCYVRHFGTSRNHVCEDIAKVKDQVPAHDLLVGGFPCQDYSVAHTGAKGIEGKKGVLWWEINDIVTAKRPSFILLENVDRIIRSPADQRGRDFCVMLRCLNDLGYVVEWRVINAADYGQAQRRRRTYIFAYQNNTRLFKRLKLSLDSSKGNPYFVWCVKEGFFASAFPVIREHHSTKQTIRAIGESVYTNLADLSENFEADFYNAGIMVNGIVYSEDFTPKGSTPITLGDIRVKGTVDRKYFLNGTLEKWEYLKGPKRIDRIRPNGEPYQFSEGGIPFPDYLDRPSRTMLTSESTLNRSTHVIEDAETGKYRLLTPVECERLNGFPEDWTDTGMPERSRYFMMGNALVVPLVTKMGKRILEIL